MAGEFEGTGVITDVISSHASVVSVTIDSVLKQFCFSKAIFYVFGNKCDGQLDNILDSGMEVNLCYKLYSNNKVYISAVWLGEKPDRLTKNKTTLRDVYSERGRVRQVNVDHLVVDALNRNVMVNKLVLFRDGYPLLEEGGLTMTVGEMVTFDAIPFENGDDRCDDSTASYQATCAWIGSKTPRVVDRFNLRLKEEEESEERGSYVQDAHGTVVVIPNDVVALIDVESEFAIGRVILFRSSFAQRCERIQEVVAVGDVLRLRLRLGYIFSERKQWFAARAWKPCVELSADGKEGTSALSIGVLLGLSADISEIDITSKEAITQTLPVTDVANKRPVVELPKSTIRKDTLKTVETVEVGTTSVAAMKVLASPGVEEPPVFNRLSPVLYNDPPLTGVIAQLSPDTALIRYEGLKVFVHSRDVYVKGVLCTSAQFRDLVSSGNSVVRFEAVKHSGSEDIATHLAVRVWIGQKPSLYAVSATLPPPVLSLFNSTRMFYGVVSKFCLPKIALLYVEEENTTVCLHVRVFPKRTLDCIACYVKIEQYFQFKIYKVDVCPKMLCAYDVRRVQAPEYQNARRKWLKSDVKSDASSGSSSAPEETIPHPSSSPKETIPRPSSSLAQPKNSKIPEKVEVEFKTTQQKEIWVPLDSVHLPSKKRALLLDCGGVLRLLMSGKSAVKIEHSLGFSSVFHDPVLYGLNEDKPLSPEKLKRCDGLHIRFDAEIFENPSRSEFFCVKRMWTSEIKRPSSERCLTSELSYSGTGTFQPTTLYRGAIHSIPLHDCAIAIIDDKPILVTFDSLVTSERINPTYMCIDQYLTEGDVVSLKISEESLPGGSANKYFKAIKCGKSANILEADDDLETGNEISDLSWRSVWGRGEYYCTGLVERNGKNFVVSFESLKQAGRRFSLDLFAAGKFFIDGTLTNRENVSDIEGRQIEFHVAYSREKAGKNSPTSGMYVACAWIGSCPPALAVLKDKLYDSKGSVCPNWLYEAVVVDFPLPDHMLCSIGPIPVVVPLTRIEKDLRLVGVKESDLTKGDLVSIRVQQVTLGDETFLMSNSVQGRLEFCEVLAFFDGTFQSPPTPLGTIKLANPSNLIVIFELCHLFACAYEDTGRNYGKIKDYLDNKRLDVGKKIYVTALKMKGKLAPYRAARLWIN